MKKELQSIDNRLTHLLHQIRSLSKAKERIDVLLKERGSINNNIRQMERVMNKIVKNAFPNSRSPQKLVFSFLQSLEDKALEIQKEEYFRAALNYNELVKSRELLDYEMDILNGKISKEDDYQQQLEELLRHRVGIFAMKKHQELSILVERLDDLSKLLLELVDAVAVAASIEKLLKRAQKEWAKQDQRVYRMKIDRVENFNINITVLSDLHDMMIEINRRYIIMQAEINDILNHFRYISGPKTEYRTNFLSTFKDVIVDDIKAHKKSNSTPIFIDSQLVHISRVLKSLRKDRDATRRRIARLRRKRDRIILNEKR